MRCSFRSTTALAAALALMAPAALFAETALGPKAAAKMDAAARADMPKRATQLDAELAKGLAPGMLACIGDAPRPCPDGEALVTPRGLGVHLSQDGMIVLAPRKEQREIAKAAKGGEGAEQAAAQADGKAQAKAERKDAKAEKAQAKAERQASKGDRDAAGEAPPDAATLAASLAQAAGTEGEAPVVLAQAEAPADAGSAPVVLPEPAGQPEGAEEAAAEPVVAEPPAPEVSEPIPVAEPEAPAEPVVAEPLPERSEPIPEAEPETPQQPAVAAPVPAPEQRPAAEPALAEPAPAPEPVPAAEPQPATEPAVAEPVPAAQPQPAPDAGAAPEVAQPATDAPADTPDAAALAAALAAGGAAPAAGQPNATAAVTGQATAPTPVEVDEAATRSLEDALQKAAEAVAPVVEPQQPAPATQTTAVPGGTAADSAAAAAAGGAAPVADALRAPATISDDATAVVVTEESSRSSSEDFATSIANGLTPEQQARFQRLQEQIAAQAAGDDPVVAGDGSDASDDDGDDKRDLAALLLGGVGGYVLANVLANNGQIALSTPDRVVVEQADGSQTIIKDDNALLLQPGARVTTEDFADGSSRTIVSREDGSRVVTIRDANLRVLRRTLVAADGTVTELINDAAPVDPVVVADLPPAARPVDLSGPVDEDALRAALAREAAVDRRFTLGQIRNIPEVRALVAPIEINAITFETGSAAISPDQAQQLATLGKVIADSVRANPGEVFLIEGHTDTVGGAAMNLALSDRRAESVALALAQYFRVPPENMVVQGYGEQYLKVNAEGDIRENRRASVRRITDLLATN